MRMQTQWRAAYGGRYGLDYTVLFEMMNLYDIKERQELLESVQIMERAALPIMNQKA
jgi:hypothetical protein